MAIETDRLISAAPVSPQEEAFERALRPKSLAEYIGQEKIRGQLAIFVEAARNRKEALDHVLLYGPPGLGKMTLAHIIAREMVVNRSAGLLKVEISPEGGLEIAKRSRGTPRVSNRLLRRVRDFAQVRAQGSISREVADAALKMLDVDVLGLDVMDRKLLSAVIEKFSGGPVGLENLAHAIGEEADTIEDVLEPYLIQQGYLQRTPRGRVATVTAYRHLGLAVPRSGGPGELFGQ